MKRMLLVLLVLSTLTIVASAGVVTLRLYAPVGHIYYGVDGGVESYPYDITVNGTHQWLMCVGYYQRVEYAQVWQATAMSVDQYALLLSGGIQEAGEVAYVYLQAKADGGNKPYENAVAWYIVEGGPDISGDPQAMALYNSVNAMQFTAGEFPGVEVYVPVPDNSPLGLEQPFLGTTPEPSSLAMLGTGVLSVCVFIRRRLL